MVAKIAIVGVVTSLAGGQRLWSFRLHPTITTIVLRSSAKFLAGGRWCWLIMAGGGWWWLVMADDEWWWLIMAGGNV